MLGIVGLFWAAVVLLAAYFYPLAASLAQGSDLLLVLIFVQQHFFSRLRALFGSLFEAVSGYVPTGNGCYQ